MWDNASLLRNIANALFGLSLVLVLYGVGRYVLQLPAFSLRTVELSAVPKNVPVAQIERVVREQVYGNFFTVDLERIRKSFEQLPWVRKVSVRRKFPWGLEVELEEHVMLARWNGSSLVNTHGEVFSGSSKDELPLFVGQPDSSAQVTGMYAELSGIVQPMQQEIVQITLTPRYSWQVKLRNGMVLALGREQMQQRLTRFVSAYPFSLALMTRPASYVDLRYRDGFAVYAPGGVEMKTRKDS